MLVYLNDVPSGGCTSFPQLGMKVQPKKGEFGWIGGALVAPIFDFGFVEERALTVVFIVAVHSYEYAKKASPEKDRYESKRDMFGTSVYGRV